MAEDFPVSTITLESLRKQFADSTKIEGADVFSVVSSPTYDYIITKGSERLYGFKVEQRLDCSGSGYFCWEATVTRHGETLKRNAIVYACNINGGNSRDVEIFWTDDVDAL